MFVFSSTFFPSLYLLNYQITAIYLFIYLFIYYPHVFLKKKKPWGYNNCLRLSLCPSVCQSSCPSITLGAIVVERKYFTCPSRESNPNCWIYRQTLYHVAIKAGFYRKAVEVYYIPIPTTLSPPKALDKIQPNLVCVLLT